MNLLRTCLDFLIKNIIISFLYFLPVYILLAVSVQFLFVEDLEFSFLRGEITILVNFSRALS